MASYSVAQAREALPDLLDRALRGEEVVLRPDGESVRKLQLVEMKSSAREDRNAFYDRLDQWQEEGPTPGLDSTVLIRRMRDEEDFA